jgi:hypothetical protein
MKRQERFFLGGIAAILGTQDFQFHSIRTPFVFSYHPVSVFSGGNFSWQSPLSFSRAIRPYPAPIEIIEVPVQALERFRDSSKLVQEAAEPPLKSG